MLTRRDFLQRSGASALAVCTSMLPSLSFANAETDARLVLVILRGAVDGLAVAAPYGDGKYRALRGELAMPDPGNENGLLRLDGLFGLHPALAGVHRAFNEHEALILHAIASPYRERSHFDGQDVLENGASATGMLRDGWLNRALAPLGSELGKESAIAMAQNTPLVLRGENSVTSWAPSQLPDAEENTIRRLQDLYADDEFFSVRLAQALKSQQLASDSEMQAQRVRSNDAQYFLSLMQATARFLGTDAGPRIAVLEAGGWDTHANQGATTGALANRLADLDGALDALRAGLGDVWSQTVVMLVTEFGRTVHVNGTRGTDHGTGTVAVLLGGAVSGGRVIADWPGLAQANLYQSRDLRPTTDLRSVFKGVLNEHLQLQPAFVERVVFPDSSAATPLQGLIKT